MPLYSYRAVTAEGEAREGQLQGNDEQSIVLQLQAKGLIPLQIDSDMAERSGGRFFNLGLARKRLSDKHLLMFTQQLSELLLAGIPIDRSLAIMSGVAEDEALLKLVSPILEGVRRGQSFSKVLAEHPDAFSQFYISLVQAAEVSGNLGEGLQELAYYLERNRSLHDKVVSALIYPIILLIVSAFSLIIILTYVVPQFQQLFEDMGKALPLSTQIVITIAEVLRDYLPYLLALVLLGYFYVRRLFTQPVYKQRWHRWLLDAPLLGILNKKIETARFALSLGTLIKGGVPVLSALSIARDTIGNSVMSEAVATTAEGLKEGRHLAGPLMETRLFPSMAMQMIQVGEETGRLDEMLIKVARVYDREVETALQRMLAVLEPLLIVGLGLIIAGIIISILVAIMSINELPI